MTQPSDPDRRADAKPGREGDGPAASAPQSDGARDLPAEAPPAEALPPVALFDARGLLCPLPVLGARKRLRALAAGQSLAVLADDPMAAIDLPHFCAEQGHALLSDQPHEGRARRFVIRKGG